MILNYTELDEFFPIYNDRLNYWIIENPKLMEQIVMSFYEQKVKSSEKFRLLDDTNEEIRKSIDIIATPYELTYEKRTLQKKLFSILINDLAGADAFEAISEAHATIINNLELIELHSGFNLYFDDEFSPDIMLKNCAVFLKNPEGTFIEKFMEYAETINKLVGEDTFVIANCDCYFSKADIIHLEKWAISQGLYILILSTNLATQNTCGNVFIIDENYCIIT